MRARQFRGRHGYWPPVLHPQTFVEKVNWRISFDRRPELAFTCDKLAMKEHARRRAPDLVRVPETYWSGRDLAELVGVDLPDHWVLKPNHASQLVHIGAGRPDLAQLKELTADWATTDYYDFAYEWAYRRARRCLLVEEFIGEPGQVPADLKVYVSDGVPRVVGVHTDRATQHRVSFHSPDWEWLPWAPSDEAGPPAPRPDRLVEMLEAASALAAGYDMMRVDFYEHAGELWFGELTPYPGAGLRRPTADFNRVLGAAWTLPRIGPRRFTRPGL
jgi:hypothetical protein